MYRKMLKLVFAKIYAFLNIFLSTKENRTLRQYNIPTDFKESLLL